MVAASLSVPAPPENIAVRSPLDFARTLDALRANIVREEMMVLHETNTQAIIARASVQSMGLMQILYFHPRYMKRVLEANPAAVIEAPLKFAARETPDSTFIHRLSPGFLFGRYEGPRDLGEELELLAARIAMF